jgi:hypothetical protein
VSVLAPINLSHLNFMYDNLHSLKLIELLRNSGSESWALERNVCVCKVNGQLIALELFYKLSI